MNKTSSILVTGGAGFIGSNLVEELLEQSHHVISLDNFDEFYSRQEKLKNLIKLDDILGNKFISPNV